MGRTGAVVLALVVGGAIGYYIGTRPKGGTENPPTPAQKCLTPGNQIIDVSLQGTPTCPDAVLSKQNNDGIIWQTTPGATLWISFPSGGFGTSGSSGNTHRFTIPQSYTPNKTPTPINYQINVFGIGTPTPQALTPSPQANGRIIIMK
jgi:hypothetical protein